MPIDSTHKNYDAHIERVTRMRDAVAGEDEVHKKGIEYLPKIDGWKNDKYKAYVNNTPFYGATERTIDGLVGLMFRKPISLSEEGLESITDDVDLKGSKLSTFAQEIAREVLTASRLGVLVEYPVVANQPTTKAEQLASNARPYAAIYKAESIINWRIERVNNVMMPVRVSLKETADDYTDDPYEPEEVERIRELILEGGQYRQVLWQKVKQDWVVIDEYTPLKKDRPLDFIPFFVFGSDDNTIEPAKPPLLSLADMNFHHYRVSADYEHGCHVSGLPTLAVSGLVLDENETVMIGGSIVSDNHQMKAEFVEVSSEFKALRTNLDSKKQEMATLGARMLEDQKKAVEAADTLQIRSNGENSVLASIANLISDQLSNMLQFMAEWAGINTDVSVSISTDFLPVRMTSQELDSVVLAWQSGAVSKETLFYNLQQGEVIENGISFEDEEERINANAPVLIDGTE